MTHRNLAPEEILPGQLVLRTEAACDLEQQQLIGVWARQRQRFVAVLQGFGPYDWDTPDPVRQVVGTQSRPPPVRLQRNRGWHR